MYSLQGKVFLWGLGERVVMFVYELGFALRWLFENCSLLGMMLPSEALVWHKHKDPWL